MRQIVIKANSYQPTKTVEKRKRARLIIAVIIGSVSVGMFYHYVLTGSVMSRDHWDTTNGTFTIRVQRRPELLSFLLRYYYEFESQVRGSKRWKTITTLLLDDPVPAPRSQIRFLNNETGYLFMSYAYAVTTDAGKHWSVFNVRADPPLGKKDSYLTIREVQLDGKGTGTMTVYSKSSNEILELQTNNYGQHWSAK